MCGCFCIEFIDVTLKVKTWLDHTNLFSPNKYKKNGITLLEYFQ